MDIYIYHTVSLEQKSKILSKKEKMKGNINN